MGDDEVRPVVEGDPVKVVDENRVEHVGLVTTVHGGFGGTYAPSINAVYVSADPGKTDPYGRQVERLSSLQHFSAGPAQMPSPGRYWINL